MRTDDHPSTLESNVRFSIAASLLINHVSPPGSRKHHNAHPARFRRRERADWPLRLSSDTGRGYDSFRESVMVPTPAGERNLGCMIKIKARGNESIEQMVRRFKKMCEKEGLNKEIKRNSYYEKPSERRRRRIRKSVKRDQVGGGR